MSMEKEYMNAYEKYADAIFRYCFYRVYEREKAKELAQETFLRAWKYIAEGRHIENMRAFFYRVAHNLIVDSSRRVAPHSLDALREKGFDAGYDGREPQLVKIEVSVLFEKIKKLDEKYQEAILLRYVEGLSPKEISKILGDTENAVSVRIHRGKKQLKKILYYENS